MRLNVLMPLPLSCSALQSQTSIKRHLPGASPVGYLSVRLARLQGTWEGKPTAVKVFNLRKRGAPAQYEMEKRAYSSLSDLHGKTVPRFLCSGLQAHTAAPVIVTSYEGKALAEDEPMPGHLRK